MASVHEGPCSQPSEALARLEEYEQQLVDTIDAMKQEVEHRKEVLGSSRTVPNVSGSWRAT